ncbi:L,D-transpeptidase family protein [Sphingomonas sp. LHG3406-1]|uniref:L,D-transpeptidase family protein n=1 Tax=Sphingomonas sp. LHG3406-1 TaxID=2804617 RepID=UPI002614DC2C|nr:L,D-transpeptidase family protein [Sphingomonas sp. LHG3406-1]
MRGTSVPALLAAAAMLFVTACRSEPEPQAAPAQPLYSMDRVTLPEAQVLPALSAATPNARPIASLLNVPLAMRYGDWRWNEDKVPPGEIWILVDLSAQTMSVFRGAHEIGTAVTLYGVDRKPTPTGRFTVLEKRKDHVSNLYNAPMPYMMRLTMDGVAIHGSDVRAGAGTHGCLGVPEDFGAKLFEQVKAGTEVLILQDARGTSVRQAQAA